MTNVPCVGVTSSCAIFGIWKSISAGIRKVSGRAEVAGTGCWALLGVELDDQLLLDGRVDLDTLGEAQDLAGEIVVVGKQPARDRRREVGRIANDRLGAGVRADVHEVVRADVERGDVHAPAVDVEVAVADELARLGARGCEAEAVDDVVEPRLEHSEQVLARDARLAAGLVVVVGELLLEHAVVALGLLLLAQLQQVLALLDAAAPVLARRVGAALDAALLGQAALALEEQLHALAAALLALGVGGTGHALPPRPAAACAGGSRCGPAG